MEAKYSFDIFVRDSHLYETYNPGLGVLDRLRCQWSSHLASREVERQFKDFKQYNLYAQFKAIYEDVARAFDRQDQVILCRSLGYDFRHSLGGEPFLRQIVSLQPLKTRVCERELDDQFNTTMDECRWAQIWVQITGYDSQKQLQTHYTLYERRFSDKNSSEDWRICISADAHKVMMLHQTQL